MADTETLRADDRLVRSDALKPGTPSAADALAADGTRKLALTAIDEWFGDQVKHLAETRHLAYIGDLSHTSLKEPTNGYALACQTRDDMRKIVGGC